MALKNAKVGLFYSKKSILLTTHSAQSTMTIHNGVDSTGGRIGLPSIKYGPRDPTFGLNRLLQLLLHFLPTGHYCEWGTPLCLRDQLSLSHY